MSAPRVVVVCGAERCAALAGVRGPLDVVACVAGRRPGPADLPREASVADGLARGVDAVVVLTPYRSLAADVALCRARGVAIACAGPVPDTGDDVCYAPGRWRFTPALRRLGELGARPAFGRPVYLRVVSGGAVGALQAWWGLVDGLDAAVGLLGAPLARLWIGAARRGNRWHGSATAMTRNGATAQIAVVPAPGPGDEAILLGTGGLVSVETGDTGLVVLADDGIHQVRPSTAWPDGGWAEAALCAPEPRPSPALDAAARRSVLAALRLAARSGRLQPVAVAQG